LTFDEPFTTKPAQHAAVLRHARVHTLGAIPRRRPGHRAANPAASSGRSTVASPGPLPGTIDQAGAVITGNSRCRLVSTGSPVFARHRAYLRQVSITRPAAAPSAPILIVMGEDDDWTPAPSCHDLAARFPSENSSSSAIHPPCIRKLGQWHPTPSRSAPRSIPSHIHSGNFP
jgi:hypothetical protein